ncbi:hypothetical protein DRN74_03360 [Candidatus Micrarchaeota archaeon]|nr:MAG: hypothetical protein DRN74_03360 [Candidatus Micrarchaeota archaeon]
MIYIEDIRDFVSKLSDKAWTILSSVIGRDDEEKALLFFAFAYLAEQYTAISEELLRQKKSAEASYYSAKAVVVRRLCHEIFEEVPEKDYYTELFHLPPSTRKMEDEELVYLHKLAQFCVEKIEPDKEMLSDISHLYANLKSLIKSIKGGPTISNAKRVLLKETRHYKDRPSKLQTIYEVVLLVMNVSAVIEALTREKTEKREEKLPGFKV